MMHGTNRPPFTADIEDVSEHRFSSSTQCACNPGCGTTPACGRGGADIPFMLPAKKRRVHALTKHAVTSPTEDQIHRALVGQLRARAKPGVVWWHTPNGGRRGRVEAARFKGLGVRPGVADLILVHRGNVYALELKSETGRPTVEQMAFMSDFNAAGGHGVICHDLDRALRVLECWGLLKGTAGA